MAALAAHIMPGGSLVLSGAFSGGGVHLAENEKYNDFKSLDSMMRTNGFEFEDRFAQYFFYRKR